MNFVKTNLSLSDEFYIYMSCEWIEGIAKRLTLSQKYQDASIYIFEWTLVNM